MIARVVDYTGIVILNIVILRNSFLLLRHSERRQKSVNNNRATLLHTIKLREIWKGELDNCHKEPHNALFKSTVGVE